jgi:hypothetical protein
MARFTASFLTWCPVPEIACILLRSKWAGVGKRVGGSAYGRIGVWRSKTAFRHGYDDQEVSNKLTTLCERRHVPPSRWPIFIATLWAGASWLFFRPAAAGLDPYDSDMGASLAP